MLEPLSDGGVRLQLSRDERALLVGLTGELRALLEVTPEDPSLRRLFPQAYDDDADERAYRELTGDSLLDSRREALELLEQTADSERLTAEEADAWLRALNDLRLVLGTAGESVPVRDGELCLGTWQRVLFLELDRERERRWLVQVVGT